MKPTPKEKAIELHKQVDDCMCGDISDTSKHNMVFIICENIMKSLREKVTVKEFWLEVAYWEDVQKESETL